MKYKSETELEEVRGKLIERRRLKVMRLRSATNDILITEIAKLQVAIDAIDAVIDELDDLTDS